MGYIELEDSCKARVAAHWVRLATGAGEILLAPEAVRLSLLPADDEQYHLAELSDTPLRPPKEYPWRPPVRLTVEARFSSPTTFRGTAGFGFWNASVTTQKNQVQLSAPQVFWVFLASPPNRLGLQPGWSGHGFFVQSLRSPSLPPFVQQLGVWALRLPLLGRLAYCTAQQIVPAAERLLPIDPTEWHTYLLEWFPKRTRCFVDGELFFEASVAPTPPLGLVFWVDNQFARIEAGRLEGGWLAVPEEQFLELRLIRLERVVESSNES